MTLICPHCGTMVMLGIGELLGANWPCCGKPAQQTKTATSNNSGEWFDSKKDVKP
jgi:hypothetical protein